MKDEREIKIKVIEELRTMPVISIVCKRTGISRATYYRWCANDRSFLMSTRTTLKEGCVFINDTAESVIISKIRDKDFNASRFWLQHHHKTYKRPFQLKLMNAEMQENKEIHDYFERRIVRSKKKTEEAKKARREIRRLVKEIPKLVPTRPNEPSSS